MEQGDKISVIIPVYKVEKFLRKCIDSVVSQTYTNLEIFLIDDGSPDNCGKICDEYAQQDKRIVVVHKKNGGLSSARNAALDQMTGEYVAFVDSDDWVDKNYIKELYNTLKKYDADISVCDYVKVMDDSIYASHNASFDKFVPVEEVYNLFFCKKRWNHTAWGKLYKKHIFKELRYDEDCRVAEDLDLICDILDRVEKGIATTSQKLYYYLVREGSISTTFSEKRFDRIKAIKNVVNHFSDRTVPCFRYVCKYMFYSYRYLYMQMYEAKDKRYIKKFNKLFNEDYKKYYKYLALRQKSYAFIFKYFRPLYIIAHKIKIKREKPLYKLEESRHHTK